MTFDHARELIDDFKKDNYIHGLGVLARIGAKARVLGVRVLMVIDQFPGSTPYVGTICASLEKAGMTIISTINGAAPNAPREDLSRITDALKRADPDVVLSFGGGSTIDCVKAAIVLWTLGGSIEDYFGTGLVSQKLHELNKQLLPHIAIQTASSSGAHLTKYSNITDVSSGQKKLIVDDAVIPILPVFDYLVTAGAPNSLTVDGALDGISHAVEVLYGSVGKKAYPEIRKVALAAISLIVQFLPQVLENPTDPQGREALGLATDLGALAIMLGGTNGAHLTSFSLVDILSHGRACGMLNPYYSVLFTRAIQEPLQLVGNIYYEHGYLSTDPSLLSGQELGVAIAQGMIKFQKSIGFPTTLAEVPGFTEAHIHRALEAAKNPQLKMKLENMPIPLTTEMVDEYMGSVLIAAISGDLSLVKMV